MDWMDNARCGGMSVDVFFTDYDRGDEFAKSFCHDCKVKSDCLAYVVDMEAVRGHLRIGVFGGTSAKDRERTVRRNARKQVTA